MNETFTLHNQLKDALPRDSCNVSIARQTTHLLASKACAANAMYSFNIQQHDCIAVVGDTCGRYMSLPSATLVLLCVILTRELLLFVLGSVKVVSYPAVGHHH